METFERIMELASHLVWPFTALVAIVLFRNPLSKLLDRVMRLNVEAGKFKLETLMRDHVPPHVLSELRRNPHQLKLSGEERRVTIGCSLQLGEGWHSSKHTVRFWNLLVLFQKETDA